MTFSALSFHWILFGFKKKYIRVTTKEIQQKPIRRLNVYLSSRIILISFNPSPSSNKSLSKRITVHLLLRFVMRFKVSPLHLLHFLYFFGFCISFLFSIFQLRNILSLLFFLSSLSGPFKPNGMIARHEMTWIGKSILNCVEWWCLIYVYPPSIHSS